MPIFKARTFLVAKRCPILGVSSGAAGLSSAFAALPFCFTILVGGGEVSGEVRGVLLVLVDEARSLGEFAAGALLIAVRLLGVF